MPVPDPAEAGFRAEAPIRVLIVGWSAFAPKVVHELDAFLAPGSHIEVCINGALPDPGALSQVPLANVAMTVTMIGDGPEHLLALGARPPFDQVIVLGYRDGLSVAEADSLTLLTLLTLRKVWPPHAMPRVPIIAQLLDQSNVELATSTGVDDFIVSDALASLMLAQLSQRRQMQAVFDELFDPGGAGVELQPASRFVTDHTVGYAEIVAAGAAQGVSVLGWRSTRAAKSSSTPRKAGRSNSAPTTRCSWWCTGSPSFGPHWAIKEDYVPMIATTGEQPGDETGPRPPTVCGTLRGAVGKRGVRCRWSS